MSRPRRPDPSALALALVATLAGLAAPARAGDESAPACGGALRVSAEPSRLVLGRDGGAELRIAAPPEVEELAVSASAGRVENVRRLPGGGFSARYRPPAERHPQVAIVAVLARTAHGLADGWLAVPLSGQGDARVRAEPGAEITLRIGDRTFGPRPVGPEGFVVIPVVVPPGVREAHHGFRPIDLRVPEATLLHVVADRRAIHADRAEQVRLLAYVVAPHGAARRGDVPVFEASRGAVSVAAREPGAFEAVWSLPAGAALEERLLVRVPGSPASRALLRLEVVPGPPATIAVAFDREAHEAGAGDVAVTARVLDAAGNPAAAEVELSADAGRLQPAASIGIGAVSARLQVEPAFGARRALTVTARAPTIGIAGARVLPLRPGPPAEARFTSGHDVLLADGTREASLRVAVLDRFDNRVEAVPAVAAERGQIVAVEADGEGAWRVRYRTPAVPERTEERVVARVGPVRAEADLLLVPPPRGITLLPVAGAALDLRGRFVAARAGLAAELAAEAPVPLPGSVGFAWRLEADALGFERTGPARTALVEGPRGSPPELSSRRPRTAVLGATFLGGATLRRELRRGPELRASLAAGGLLARVDPAGLAPEVGLAPAARLTLGADFRLARLTPFVELSALLAGGSPAGAFTAVGLAAGARFDLGGPPWPRSSSSTTSR
jgi:hypothetical protein